MFKNSKVIFSIFSVIVFFGSNAVIAGTVITVDPTDSQGWFAKGGNTGTGGLMDDATTAGSPLPTGALQFITDGSAGQIIQAARIPVVTVDKITEVSWAFNSDHATNVPHAKIEYWNTTRSGTLVSIPSGSYTPGAWKTEDGTTLMWWSTETGFGSGDVRTFAAWQAELAGVFSNYFVVGMGSTGGAVPATTAYADQVHLAGTRGNTPFDDTWDFEGEATLPPEPAPSQNVPTLSEWALIMMSMLLALGVFARQRKLR